MFTLICSSQKVCVVYMYMYLVYTCLYDLYIYIYTYKIIYNIYYTNIRTTFISISYIHTYIYIHI